MIWDDHMGSQTVPKCPQIYEIHETYKFEMFIKFIVTHTQCINISVTKYSKITQA